MKVVVVMKGPLRVVVALTLMLEGLLVLSSLLGHLVQVMVQLLMLLLEMGRHLRMKLLLAMCFMLLQLVVGGANLVVAWMEEIWVARSKAMVKKEMLVLMLELLKGSVLLVFPMGVRMQRWM